VFSFVGVLLDSVLLGAVLLDAVLLAFCGWRDFLGVWRGSVARFECGTAGCTLFEPLLSGFVKRRGLGMSIKPLSSV